MNNNDMNNNNINPAAMNFGPPQPEQTGAATNPAPAEVAPQPAPMTPPVAPAAPTVAPTPAEVAPQPTPIVAPTQPVEAPMAQPAAPVDNTQAPMATTPVQPMGTTEINGAQVSGDSGLEETEKKKTPIGMILLTVLVLAGVGVFLFMYLTGKINFGGKTAEDTPAVEDNTNTVELAMWMNYLLEQNITEVKLTRTTEDGSGNAEATLTTDQLRELFNQMTSYTLNKGYISGTGFTYGTILSISYSKDSNNYVLEIAGGFFNVNDHQDQDLLTALDGSNPSQVSEQTEENNMLYYNLTGLDESVFEQYLNPTIDEDNSEEEIQEENNENQEG